MELASDKKNVLVGKKYYLIKVIVKFAKIKA